MATLPIRMPDANFSWLGELPSVYGAAQTEGIMKRALEGVNFDDPTSVQQAASKLARAGPEGIKLSIQLAETARKRQELLLGQQAYKEGAAVLGGGGTAGAPAAGAPTGPAGAPRAEVPQGPDSLLSGSPVIKDIVAQREAAHPELQERPGLFAKMINWESRGKPLALSPKGAMGPGQLMPGTARELGVTNPWDPEQNLTGASTYLTQQLQKYGGNEGLALAAYNAGPGRVDAWLAGRGQMPAETQRYVAGITGRPIQQWAQMGGRTEVPPESARAQTGPVPGAPAATRAPTPVTTDEDDLKAATKGAGKAGAEYRKKAFSVSPEAATYGIHAGRPFQFPGMAKTMEKSFETVLTRQNEEYKRESEDFSPALKEIHERRDSAQGMEPLLNRMEKIVNDPRFVSGTTTDFFTRMASAGVAVGDFARALGMTVPEFDRAKAAVGQQELFRALSNELTLKKLGGKLGTAVSNTDREFMNQSVPNLAATKEANKYLIELTRALAKRDKEMAQIAGAYHIDGGRNVSFIKDYLQAYAERNQLHVKRDGTLTELGKQRELAERASRSGMVVTPPEGGTTPAPGAPGTGAQISKAAVDALRANPSRAGEFDAKFGPGSAAAILGGGT